MLSRRTRFFALIALLTAALVPGAAVYVSTAHSCSLVQPESPVQFVAESEVIVLGTVDAANEKELILRPEAYLKGPATADRIRLVRENDLCPSAELGPGDRVLVYMFTAARPSWPLINQVYVLADGHATREGEAVRTEIEVVSAIRSLTGQYAVPAATESEGAGIDWSHTIIPLGVVMAILLGIGLVLMRVWHRIDPS